jgi:hypothetical protein
MLIANTRSRDFIHFCKSIRDNPALKKPGWVKGIFSDVDAAISAYVTTDNFATTATGKKGDGHSGVRLASQNSMLRGAGRKFSTYAIISTTLRLALKT